MTTAALIRRSILPALNPFEGPPQIVNLSPAIGPVAQSLSSSIEGMLKGAIAGAGQLRNTLVTENPLPGAPEKLFSALAAAKVMTSKVSMHLEDNWRRQLFRDLDDIFSADAWDEHDQPVVPQSFETYLRFQLFCRPTKTPSLGVSDGGNLLAGWHSGPNHLTLEFCPRDGIRWVLVRRDEDDEAESAAGLTQLARLMDVLAPYRPDDWLR